MNEIVSWVCHVCGKKFEAEAGGACFQCNQITCKKHLKQIKIKDRDFEETKKVLVCKLCKEKAT